MGVDLPPDTTPVYARFLPASAVNPGPATAPVYVRTNLEPSVTELVADWQAKLILPDLPELEMARWQDAADVARYTTGLPMAADTTVVMVPVETGDDGKLYLVPNHGG